MKSSQDYWKLAVGSKAMFISQIATGLQNDYNEHTEGWVIKKYQGQNTLNVFSSEGKTTENVSSSSSASRDIIVKEALRDAAQYIPVEDVQVAAPHLQSTPVLGVNPFVMAHVVGG